MNNKIFIPLSAAAVLLGLLFVSLGGRVPALAQQETPEPQIASPENPVPTEDAEENLPPSEYSTETLEGGEIVPQAPGETDDLLPGLWLIDTIDSAGNVGEHTSLELDTAGYPHISYYDVTNDDLKYAYKDASGWHTQIDADQGGSNTILRLDNQDYAHILYMAGSTIHYAYQDASGWYLDTDVASGLWISMDLDSSGNPHIAFITTSGDSSNPISYYLWYGFRSNGVWSIQELSSTQQSYLDLAEGTSIAVDQQDHPHITYALGKTYIPIFVYARATSLYYIVFDGSSWASSVLASGACVSDSPNTIFICDRYGTYSDLRLSDSGAYRVSFYHDTYGIRDRRFFRIERLEFKSDTSWASFAYSNFDKHTSLALDSLDHPYISYYNTASTELRLAGRELAGWQTQTVDSDGAVGSYSSLEIDRYDHPYISYYDASNGDLKLAQSHGIFLRPVQQSKTGARGGLVSHRIILYNRTDAPDSFSLELGSHAWQVGPLANPVGPIPVGGSLAVTVTVGVPADTDWYSTDSVEVIARSQNDPTQTTNPARLTTQAYAPPRLSIKPELNSQNWAGGQATQFLSIHNGNGITLTYNLYNSGLPPADIGLLMHMEDPTSATAFVDSSQYNNILTCANDPIQCPIMEAPGVVGHGFEFTPSENVIHGVDASNLNPTQAIAISVWINPSEWSDKFIVSKGMWGEAYNLYEQPGELRLRLWGVGEVSAPAPSLNQWHHVVGQYDGSRMQIWIDGSLRGEIGATGVISVTGNQLKIGALDSVEYLHTNHYVGSMDEMAILSRALTPTEIHYIYQTRSYDPITDLIASVNAEGEIPSNQIVNVPVVFDARWKQTGVYAQEIYLDTNDPAQGHVVIPVRMEVVEPPYRLFLPVLNQ